MDDKKYPNCELLKEHGEDRRAVNEFVAWLNSKGLFVAMCDEFDRGMPAGKSSDSLFMEYIGVNEVQLENERREILAIARSRHQDSKTKPAPAAPECQPGYS